ncbi:hypothetical protein D0T53_00025 [Dysgonomonas sp. 216]|uniref:polymorphic toxin type 23 domain-containing protein n=1 Tax=Dysgonomonas sp. 216 TaxID=2302934 RepID=UPI0013D35BB1|nr:polymorphic toxin type 23 domain-containing protein [Dysgonomonas sp. 216]NDW17299.1 hypothetical protein [Dysgonomonas sp. 216]
MNLIRILIHIISKYIGKIAIALLLVYFATPVYGQYKFRYDNHYPASLSFAPDKSNGFKASVSLVMMFTAGATDRNGLRFGAGITLSHTIDNWTFTAGIDAYKATQHFGIGTSFAGVNFDTGKYGASYYVNKYYQGGKQVSGILGVHLDDFEIAFEDDILAYPFSGFKVYDRYRSAALEIRYKGFMVGTNVYTTDMDGRTDVWANNSKGIYMDGKQVSSPVYVGYTTHNVLFRYGLNNGIGGFFGQNAWHRYLFDTPDFKTGNYNNQFFQIGLDKPYTLY